MQVHIKTPERVILGLVSPMKLALDWAKDSR